MSTKGDIQKHYKHNGYILADFSYNRGTEFSTQVTGILFSSLNLWEFNVVYTLLCVPYVYAYI